MTADRPFSVELCGWLAAEPHLRRVRHVVFVVEQGVPEVLEWDTADERSIHALAADEHGAPIGCARLLDDGHIGRVAVLREWRGRGVGTALMTTLIERATERGDAMAIVNAQLAALRFYERQGFAATGDVFDEAGIPHRVMTLVLHRILDQGAVSADR